VSAGRVQIALLRGVNLAGARRVSMTALRELLAGHGYADVRTYLQSGNVVLTSAAPPERLERELERQIAEGFGIDVQVHVRTRGELATVVERDPLGDLASDPAKYQVSFLSAEPNADAVRELMAVDVAPERVVVIGREVYAWHPGGVGRSPLAKLLTERRLGVGITARNWKTVTTLLELAGG
jgi:uncharacterized protein (DUF1697 family)